jgi:predicted RNA binding protein YcfA (HicA-like mRNA interferase family)
MLRSLRGRWLAEVIDLPGVLAYGATRDEALAKAEALALRVIDGPFGTRRACARVEQAVHSRLSQWPSTRARRVLAALFRIGWTVKRTTGSHRVWSGQVGMTSCLRFTTRRKLARGCSPGSDGRASSDQATSDRRWSELTVALETQTS